jgi:lysophospholipase L1-like esterase
MATVTVVTAAKSLEIEGATIANATVNSSGHLIITKLNGNTIDAGSVTDVKRYSSGSYIPADGAFSYVGTTDPGSVPNGAMWFDTSITRLSPVVASRYNVDNDALYSGTAPTYVTTQTTTPTATYIKYAPDPVALSGSDVRGPFFYAGANNFQIGTVTPDTSYVLPLSRYPNTYASGQGNWSVQFSTNSRYVEFRFKYISTATMFRMHINGRKVTDQMQSIGGTTAGSGHIMKIDFGSAAIRDIRIDLTTCPFGGVYLPPDTDIWASPLNGGRFMGYGDSLTDGSSKNVGAGQGTWLMRAGRLLGFQDIWDQGRGGTGYITPGSHVTFGARLDIDGIQPQPDVMVIWGGYNDNTGDQTAIRSAVDDVFTRAKAGLPYCRIMAVGCWSNVASPSAGISNTDNTIKAAAAAAGIPFVSPVTGIAYDANGVRIEGTGTPWITTGNVATYVGSAGGDTVHPTDVGHEYIARRLSAALRAARIA